MDPTQPIGLQDNQQWARVHHVNKEAAEATQGDVDVVFLGDSITEGWVGTSWGRKNAKVHNVPQVFESYFSIENGGEYEGLALGVAGDSVSDVCDEARNSAFDVKRNSRLFPDCSHPTCCGVYKMVSSPIT